MRRLHTTSGHIASDKPLEPDATDADCVNFSSQASAAYDVLLVILVQDVN